MQKILISILLLVTLSACSVYQADIEQGNMVSKEEAAKLSVGMDKNTVERLLGTSLVKDAFDSDHWDYFYSLRRDGTLVNKTLLSLDFKQGRLVKITGLPSH